MRQRENRTILELFNDNILNASVSLYSVKRKNDCALWIEECGEEEIV
jgi:hypothetical protein